MKSGKLGFLAVLLVSCQLAACGTAASKADRDDGASTASTFNSHDAEKSLDSYERTSSSFNVTELFKDEQDFTIAQLESGASNCSDITRHANLKDLLLPWPESLRSFLVAYLDRFPRPGLIEASVAGFYLVKDEALRFPGGGAAAGLACDRGDDNKGVIFLSATSFVSERSGQGRSDQSGPGVWHDNAVVTDRYILQQTGDNAAITLIHELTHAIDNKLFTHATSETRQLRQAIYAMSWQGFSEPLYQKVSIYSLGSRHAPALQLDSNKTPEELAGELRYLADKTNFIVPYTMASSAEDFAESIAVYYFGVAFGSWQIRTVYDKDLKKEGLTGANKLYVHDTKKILGSSPEQKKKLCAMAELMFGSCEL